MLKHPFMNFSAKTVRTNFTSICKRSLSNTTVQFLLLNMNCLKNEWNCVCMNGFPDLLKTTILWA